MTFLARYTRWLHTQWPAGTVERLPVVQSDRSTNVPGVYISGDLTGIPLLKFACHTGARVAQRIADDPTLRTTPHAGGGAIDLAIIGAGVSADARGVSVSEVGREVSAAAGAGSP